VNTFYFPPMPGRVLQEEGSPSRPLPRAESVESLTENQAARRERVIKAALDLGGRGGYEAVQMRDVAAHANVALGTIYRYFTSKDHLLAASMVDWSADLRRRVAERPPTDPDPADRMVDVIRRATRMMERQPSLAAALVTACSAHDPGVVACQREVTATIREVLAAPIADLDAERREGVVMLLAHVWHSVNIEWVDGAKSVEQVGEELETAARLLLSDR
jgi:AcrR family transcriptional regulator